MLAYIRGMEVCKLALFVKSTIVLTIYMPCELLLWLTFDPRCHQPSLNPSIFCLVCLLLLVFFGSVLQQVYTVGLFFFLVSRPGSEGNTRRNAAGGGEEE